MGTGSFPGVEAAGGWGWPPTPIQCRGPRKSIAIPLLTLRAFVAYKKGENLPNSVFLTCTMTFDVKIALFRALIVLNLLMTDIVNEYWFYKFSLDSGNGLCSLLKGLKE